MLIGPGKNSTLPAVSTAHAQHITWSRKKLYTPSCIYCACSLVQRKTLHFQLHLLRMLIGPEKNSTLPAASTAHAHWSRENFYTPSCIYCACSAYHLVQEKTIHSQLYLLRMISISLGPEKNSTLPAVSTAHAQHITWSRKKLYTPSCIYCACSAYHWSREKLYTPSCIYCACSAYNLVQKKTIHSQLYLLRMLSISLVQGKTLHSQLYLLRMLSIHWSREKLYTPSCTYCACSAYHWFREKL
jgi:hypothetical protein